MSKEDDAKDSGIASGASGASTTGTGRARGRGRGRSSIASSAAPTPTPTDEKNGNGKAGSASPPGSSGGEPEDLVARAAQDFNCMTLGVMRRPNRGTLGRKIMVDCNYFRLSIGRKGQAATLVVQRYQVDLVDCRRRLQREDYRCLFWLLVKQHPEVFKNPYELLYDDSRCCYSLSQLDLQGQGEKEFELECALADDNQRMSTYKIRFLYTGPHTVDVREAYRGSDRTMSPVQIIDLILSQNIRCGLHPELSERWYSHGKSVFTRPSGMPNAANQIVPLSSGREMWTGFHSAAKMSESEEPLVNVDVSVTAFYTQCTLIEFLCHILNEGRDGNGPMGGAPPTYQPQMLQPDTPWSAQWSVKLNRELKGLRLSTNHLLDKQTGQPKLMCHKFYKMGKPPQQEMFTLKDGTQLSVWDHFEANHPGLLKYRNLPCVCVGKINRNIMIPFELLSIDAAPQKVPHSRVAGEQTARLIRNSAKEARIRKEKILELLRAAQATNDPFMEAFGLSLDLNPLQLDARVLDSPRLLHNGGQRLTPTMNGEWRMGPGTHFYVPVNIEKWGAIAYRIHPNKASICGQFVQCLPQWMGFFGASMSNNPLMSQVNHFEELKQTIEKWGKNGDAKFVMVFFPSRDPTGYNNMKYTGEVVPGVNVITQGILVQNADKAIRSQGSKPNATAENLCLKINMKNGGINNGIESDKIFAKFTADPEAPTLFLGVDVTHPGPNDRGPSIAAVVGNLDEGASKWGASVKVQRHRREHVIYMRDQIGERMMRFFWLVKKRPTRIVIFRDGVSEGEFEKVLREEMASVRAAVAKLNHKATLTYIVVQKRHHTRFFPTNPQDGVGRMGNVPPGLVVDKEIVSPDQFDYFLCSHLGIQGTARPAHFCVLHDENNFSADEIQMLSYKLCFTYGRCNKSVSIPAPVYLADKAATRARVHYDARFGSSSSGTDQGPGGGPGGAGGRGLSTVHSDDVLQAAVEVTKEMQFVPYFA